MLQRSSHMLDSGTGQVLEYTRFPVQYQRTHFLVAQFCAPS
jgi:hypothetical protein